jgi:predicted MFS family arabinose efflux permease
VNPVSRAPALPGGRNARLLLLGDGLSAFGGWIDFLAILTLAAYQFHVTPYEMAAVSAAGLLPGMLAAPLIGRLCDRGDAKRLLLLSVAGRVAVTAAILFCGDYTAFLAWIALRSVFAGVAPPAINVLAMRVVPPDGRARFYAVLNVLNNSAKVLAPAIGTVSSSLSGEGFALLLSLAFSAAALAVFAAVAVAAPAPAAEGTAAAAEAAPVKSLLPVLWIAATCAFFIFMTNNLVPLVLQQGGFDKALLGVLVSSAGAGNILAGLWLAKRPVAGAAGGEVGQLLRPALWQVLGFGVIGLLLWRGGGAAAGLLPLVFFFIGTASARYAIALNVYLSAHFAAAIGQVSGLLQAWQQAMIFVAPLVGAVVLDAWGAPALFAFATGSALASFSLFALVRVRLQR